MSVKENVWMASDGFLPSGVGVVDLRCLLLLMCIPLILMTAIYELWGKRSKLYGVLPGTNLHPFVEMAAIVRLYFQNRYLEQNIWNFQMINSWCAVYRKEGICRSWIANYPIIIVFRADFFEAILSSSANIYKRKGYDFLYPWLRDGLLTSNGAKWRSRRKLLTPSFHFRILEDFCPVFNDHSIVMLDVMRDLANEEWIDIVPLITRCTLDIICETSMGIKLDSQHCQDKGYLKNLEKVGELFLSRAVTPWLWPNFIFFRTPTGKRFMQHVNHLFTFGKQVIAEKKLDYVLNNKKQCDFNDNYKVAYGQRKRMAFMDILLHHHMEEGTLSEDDILDEVNLFMFGGHDTTAFTVIWTLYLLGHHLDVQKRVQEEVDAFYGNNTDINVEPEDLKHFKYMDCVIKVILGGINREIFICVRQYIKATSILVTEVNVKAEVLESMRLYPSIPFIGRDLQEDVNVGGYYIPKGTSCLLFLYQLHRDPNVFPNPEVYDPDRFLPENYHGRNPFEFLPFSAGSRNCIGQKYGIMEAKVMIAHVMRNYTIVSLDTRDKIPLGGELVLRPKVPLRVKIIPRKLQGS